MPIHDEIVRGKKIVTVYVENGLDQPVSVQILGAVSSTPANTVAIGTSFTVSAGGADFRTLVPEYAGWIPFITVSLSCPAAPTTGSVRVLLVKMDGTVTTIVRDLGIRDTATHDYSTDPSNILVVTGCIWKGVGRIVSAGMTQQSWSSYRG
jgi:hypothetical protein